MEARTAGILYQIPPVVPTFRSSQHRRRRCFVARCAQRERKQRAHRANQPSSPPRHPRSRVPDPARDPISAVPCIVLCTNVALWLGCAGAAQERDKHTRTPGRGTVRAGIGRRAARRWGADAREALAHWCPLFCSAAAAYVARKPSLSLSPLSRVRGRRRHEQQQQQRQSEPARGSQASEQAGRRMRGATRGGSGARADGYTAVRLLYSV